MRRRRREESTGLLLVVVEVGGGGTSYSTLQWRGGRPTTTREMMGCIHGTMDGCFVYCFHCGIC